MGLVNALLVSWPGGYRWVQHPASIAANGRREGYVTLGNATSEAEVDRVAGAILADGAYPRVTITAGLEPAGATDTPYEAFGVGDVISVPDEAGAPAQTRVRALTVTEDQEGNPTFVPELGTMRDERERVLQRWLKRMANGTLGGTVESATPPAAASIATQAAAAPGAVQTPPCFSLPGALTLATSGRWYPPATIRVGLLVASLRVAGGTDTTIALLKNGAQVATITIQAGQNLATASMSELFEGPQLDYIQAQTLAVGTAAEDLDLQLRLA